MKFIGSFPWLGLLLAIMGIPGQVYGQTAYWWTWMSGDNKVFNYDGYVSATNYGAVGVMAATNNPGIRDSQGGWVDTYGNFWFYGGEDINTLYPYGDLWEYSSGNGQWTWVGGNNYPYARAVYTGQNPNPGARFGHSCATDASGKFWLFGGMSPDFPGTTIEGYFNDLWTCDPSTGQWTWVSGGQGGNNLPTGRQYASTWFDAAGNLWLFGGEAFEGELNDLWEYTTAGQWVLIRGGSGASYGTQGDGEASNMPPARYQQSACVDGAGHFWIFGGSDYNGNAYNDLWEYDPDKEVWTWVSGTNGLNQNGIYGTPGAPGMPGGRYGQSMLFDRFGNILIFGGGCISSDFPRGALNDLWSYDILQKTWTWVNGSQSTESPGLFGTLGTGAAANLPPPRFNASSWLDGSGNLWIFGGWTRNPFDAGLDDVWRLAPETPPLPIESVSLQGLAQGNNNLLTWQTIDEINTTDFKVERSTDGTNFTDIGSVTAIGSGNNGYSFTDNQLPTASKFFYRLKMSDKDGVVNYSQTIVLYSAAASGLSVYPNPAHGSAILQLIDNSLLNTPARLLTIDGKPVRQYLITSQQQQLDLNGIAHGVYLLQMANGTTIRITVT